MSVTSQQIAQGRCDVILLALLRKVGPVDLTETEIDKAFDALEVGEGLRAQLSSQVSLVLTERGYFDTKGGYSPTRYALRAAPE